MLKGENVSKYFGGLAAVKNVDFYVKRGEILGLIGPNGAGKTTLFNLITGVYRPDTGIVKFNGRKITGLKPHRICRLGIGRTYQLVRPFADLSTLENVMVGALFGRGGKAISLEEARREASRILDFVGLSKERNTPAKSLTIVDRKRVEVARALATKPELLLMDEVVAGLNPTETVKTMELIKKLRDDMGITIFLIEHVMKAVMGTSDRIIVLHHGEKIAEGTPREIANDEKVVEAYLGERVL